MLLTAGAARVVATTPVGYRMDQRGFGKGRSTGVHRDLYARSRVIFDGPTTLDPSGALSTVAATLRHVSTHGPYDDIKDVPLHEVVEMGRYRRFYGTTTSPFAPEAGDLLVYRAIELMREVDG